MCLLSRTRLADYSFLGGGHVSQRNPVITCAAAAAVLLGLTSRGPSLFTLPQPPLQNASHARLRPQAICTCVPSEMEMPFPSLGLDLV